MLCHLRTDFLFVEFNENAYSSISFIFRFPQYSHFSLSVFFIVMFFKCEIPIKKFCFVLIESGKQWQGKCKSVRAFSVMFVTRMLLMDVINDDYCVCVCVYLVKKCTLVALSHFLWAIRAISLLSHIFSHTSNAHSLLCITFQVSKVDSLE